MLFLINNNLNRFNADYSATKRLAPQGYNTPNYGASYNVQYDVFGGRELQFISGGKINPDYKAKK